MITMSVRTHYDNELKAIHDSLAMMCRHIEEVIEKSVKTLANRELLLVKEVMEEERLIDKIEQEIERKCLKILMMETPVASDFRNITATLKMITDLERIGDQSRDIAEITTQFKDDGYIDKLEQIMQMADIVIKMVKDGVYAFIEQDVELARSLYKTDDEVDELFLVVKKNLAENIKQDPDTAEQVILLMMIAKYLERVGDHATNIGEWAEYAITGNHPYDASRNEKIRFIDCGER